MCEHGDTVDLRVLVPSHLAAEVFDTWKTKPIDRCIAPLVAALNAGGVPTVASCCGHGRAHGSIVLADGRDLWVTTFDPANYDTRNSGVVPIHAPTSDEREARVSAEERWEIEQNVECVVCPECAFTFDAVHRDADGGGYSCPCCWKSRAGG